MKFMLTTPVFIFHLIIPLSCIGEMLKSNPVSTGNGDYRLHADGSKLYLSHTDLKKSIVVDPYDDTTGIEFSELVGKGKITGLILSRFVHKRLVSVVEVYFKEKNRYDYYCLTFHRVASQLPKGNTVEPAYAKLVSSPHNLSILAVNGNIKGDAILVVLGEYKTDKFGAKFETGYMFFHGCANPSAIGARLGRMEVKWDDLKFDFNE